MITRKPEVDPEGLYNVGQTAKALGIDRHTLARYARQGLIRMWRRKAGGLRVTTGREIIKCWKAKYCKEI